MREAGSRAINFERFKRYSAASGVVDIDVAGAGNGAGRQAERKASAVTLPVKELECRIA